MKGILFKPDMIQAIIEGRKTQTRRVIKPQPEDGEFGLYWWKGDWSTFGGRRAGIIDYGKKGNDEPTWTLEEIASHSLYGIGETVYIKEAWATEKRYDHLKPSKIPHTATIFYVSDGVGEWPSNLSIGKLRSPLFMPEWAARYFIVITDVRVERMQEITEIDCKAEGVELVYSEIEHIHWRRPSFRNLWNSINKDYPWESNPWVFVYNFMLKEGK